MRHAFSNTWLPSASKKSTFREERDVVSEVEQLVGQPCNDTLGAAMKFRWHALGKRGDLGNSHRHKPSGAPRCLLTISVSVN